MAVSLWFLILLGLGLIAGISLMTRYSKSWMVPIAGMLLILPVLSMFLFGAARHREFARRAEFRFHHDFDDHCPAFRFEPSWNWHCESDDQDDDRNFRCESAPPPATVLELPSSEAAPQLTKPETLLVSTKQFRARGTAEQPPTWLGEQSDNIRQDGRIKKLAVSSQWFASADEALDQLTSRTREAVSQAFHEQHGVALATIPTAVLEHAAVGDCQLERVIKDFGKGIREPMFRAHARLNIDTSSGSMLHQHWSTGVRDSNLWRLGIVCGCVTICLGSFAQFLRWNRATAGQYRKRLFTAATVVASASAVAAVWLPSWLHV